MGFVFRILQRHIIRKSFDYFIGIKRTGCERIAIGLRQQCFKGKLKGKERKEKEIIIEDELTFGNFSATFEMAWKEWIEYKKSQHNFSYKTKKTEQIAINSLIKQFPNQETKAIRAIEFSIGNGYQGIFAPNENQQSSQPQKLMNFR